MTELLSERQKAYEDVYDHRIIKRLPLIIRLDGRGFSRLTKRLPRPYCSKMLDLMANTMLNTAMEVEGAIFAYQQSDEITIVLRNDKSYDSEPWFQNRIQKIVSITASLATMFFIKNFSSMDNPPDINNNAIFDCRVFAVPSLQEAANNLIFRQQDCIRNAITSAAQAELGKQFGKKTALKLLHNKNSKDRLDLLLTKCSIDFDKHYPSAFRMGVGAYKIPTLIKDSENMRSKWTLDKNVPSFITDKNFILNILHSGVDVFRAERDLKSIAQEEIKEELNV